METVRPISNNLLETRERRVISNKLLETIGNSSSLN